MPKSEEFFYRDKTGRMRDAELHNPIIEAGDRKRGLTPTTEIDEAIMAPIRKKYRDKAQGKKSDG